MKYPKLFQAGKIAALDIKNRIVMEPVATGTATSRQPSISSSCLLMQRLARKNPAAMVLSYMVRMVI